MSEFSFRKGPRRKVSINLTSLIDVLFLLLIFLMLTSTFRRAGEMDLELATSSTAAAAELSDDEELLRLLSEAHESDPDRPVLLNAEAEARHADVVRLIDIVRETGYGGLSLGTELRPRALRSDQ
jgi:biopolymer transport protein ExbD